MTDSASGRRPATGADDVEVRRVGPGASMASDNAFAAALLGLWHRVAQAGGSVGFVAPVDRTEVGAAVSEVVAGLRSGRAHGFALTRKRDVIGFALLESGIGASAHTAQIGLVMVEPARQGAGLGTDLMGATLRFAAAAEVERIRVVLPADERLQSFFGRFGFVESGRSPGWIRDAAGLDIDAVLMTAPV